MTIAYSIAPDEESEEDENKFICNGLDCQEKVTEQLELPFGEYGSTLFYLCRKCKEKIQSLRSI